tara:strand:+ start:671 stop:1456 length:786 start_codon:yes stop_codon:yes gene_type:complete
MVNPYEQAAQSMMQAGIGSLSGNKYDGLNSMMTTSPAGNNYYQPNFNVVNSDTTNKFKYRNNDSSGMMYSISDFINPDTGNAMSMSQASNAFAPFNSSARFVYPDGSGYEERGGNTYPIQLKGPQTWRINPGNNKGIQAALNNKYKLMNATSYMDPTADDYFLREFGQYMKRFLPGYDAEQDEFRQKQFRDSLEEENTTPDFIFQEDETGLPLPIMEAGMDDSFQYLQRQIEELNPDDPNYEDMLELLQSDMEMKYPFMLT